MTWSLPVFTVSHHNIRTVGGKKGPPLRIMLSFSGPFGASMGVVGSMS